ncbi:MAG: hypothetical protein LBK73_07115 [Treponema sp.]|nr:hypothetical protein [Treponema sp.]
MKKNFSKKGEAAKQVAKVVGKSVAVGVAALGLGMAGCGGAPAPAPVAQTFEGPIVHCYDGNNPRGELGKIIVVDADGNSETTPDQKHIYIKRVLIITLN